NLPRRPRLALPMPTTALVALTTLASEADARALVTALLADRLIACGTLLPAGRSLYRWQGKTTEEAEVVVLLKTDQSQWDAGCGACSSHARRRTRPRPGQRRSVGRARGPARGRSALQRGPARLRAGVAGRPGAR